MTLPPDDDPYTGIAPPPPIHPTVMNLIQRETPDEETDDSVHVDIRFPEQRHRRSCTIFFASTFETVSSFIVGSVWMIL